jgi:hypothetical protein
MRSPTQDKERINVKNEIIWQTINDGLIPLKEKLKRNKLD